jgi:hypothetical protein
MKTAICGKKGDLLVTYVADFIRRWLNFGADKY